MPTQIDCIEKDDRLNPHEAIQNIGGRNPDGKRWSLTQKQAIDGIDSGKWDFYVVAAGRHVKVIVATSRYGNKYIKTEADGDSPNNLLSLQSCQLAA